MVNNDPTSIEQRSTAQDFVKIMFLSRSFYGNGDFINHDCRRAREYRKYIIAMIYIVKKFREI